MGPTTRSARLVAWAGRTRGRLERRWVGWALVVAYAALVAGPMADVLSTGRVFGYDWGEYAYTAQAWRGASYPVLAYPYPGMTAVYYVATGLGVSGSTVPVFAAAVTVFLLAALSWCSYRLFLAVVPSRSLAFCAAGLVATSPLFLNEAGWAGQAQFVALVLGVVGIALAYRTLATRTLRTVAVLAGLFAVSAAFEPYATIECLVATGCLLLFAGGDAHRWLRRLRDTVLVGAGPLAVVGALALGYPSLGSNGLGAPVAASSQVGSILVNIDNQFTGDRLDLAALYLAIVVAYLLFAPRPRLAEPRTLVVPFLWLAAGVQVLVFTDVIFSGRAAYFLPLPIAATLLVALDGCRTPRPAPSTSGAAASRLRRAARRWAPTIAVLLAVSTVVQAAVAVESYPPAVQYYSYSSGLLSELNWLQGEPGGVVYLSPTSDFFPAAWAIGRDIYPGPPAEPALFLRTDQRDAVLLGNTIAWGESWLDSGGVIATNAEPAAPQPSPAVFGYRNDQLIQLLDLNDALQLVSYRPSGGGPTTTVNLSAAPRIVAGSNATEIWTNYTWPALTVVKSISADGAGDLAVRLTGQLTDESLENLSVRWVMQAGLPVSDVSVTEGAEPRVAFTQTYFDGFLSTPFPASVTAMGQNLSVTGSYDPADSFGLPEADFNATASGPSTENFSVTLLVSVPGLMGRTGAATTEVQAMAENSIRWIVVDREVGSELLERFTHDTHLLLYRTTAHYLVFELA